jgi:hypothetical protein
MSNNNKVISRRDLKSRPRPLNRVTLALQPGHFMRLACTTSSAGATTPQQSASSWWTKTRACALASQATSRTRSTTFPSNTDAFQVKFRTRFQPVYHPTPWRNSTSRSISSNSRRRRRHII